MALEHSDLIAKYQDLGVFGQIRPREQGHPAE